MSHSILPSKDCILSSLGIDPTIVKSKESHWQRVHYRAAMNWLIKYYPSKEASNSEQIKGYLEAFHHFCEVEAWEKAKKILLTSLQTPTQGRVCDELRIWGLYRTQIQVCNRILNKLDVQTDAIWLSVLGLAYEALGQYKQAIDFHQQNLAISQEGRNRRAEATGLSNLGIVYYRLGKYSNPI